MVQQNTLVQLNTLKKLAKRIPVYPPLFRVFETLHRKLRSTNDVFSEIYKTNTWGAKDSVSGSGSDYFQTRVIFRELPLLIDELNIATMLDIPCGDFFWMKTLDLNAVNYIGSDVVEELIHKNTQNFEKENIHFRRMDLLRSDLPTVDLIFCRDCLVHLSFKDIFFAIRNICASKSKYLLTTTFTDRTENRDIETGEWRAINLQAAPFLLPKPIRIINEECSEGGGIYRDKSLALWRINDIRGKLTTSLSFLRRLHKWGSS